MAAAEPQASGSERRPYPRCPERSTALPWQAGPTAGRRHPAEASGNTACMTRKTTACDAIDGSEHPHHDLVPLNALRPSLVRLIRRDQFRPCRRCPPQPCHRQSLPQPLCGADASSRQGCAFRTRRGDREIHRHARDDQRQPGRRGRPAHPCRSRLTALPRSAAVDLFISFSLFLCLWMLWNALQGKDRLRPFPFILLNLMLSTLAAVQARRSS